MNVIIDKQKKKLVLGLFFVLGIVLSLGFVSAALCKGNDGYYHDCHKTYYDGEDYTYVNYGDSDYHKDDGHKKDYHKKYSDKKVVKKEVELKKKYNKDKKKDDYKLIKKLNYYPGYNKDKDVKNKAQAYYGSGMVVVVDKKDSDSVDKSYWRYKEDYESWKKANGYYSGKSKKGLSHVKFRGGVHGYWESKGSDYARFKEGDVKMDKNNKFHRGHSKTWSENERYKHGDDDNYYYKARFSDKKGHYNWRW
ncbi:hypothetical protein HOD75_01505 [archaeon]|nr:hypothetical protein [archaeon]MBT4241554.1 hypothetical protein [archaeon]MBT4417574.1 hypothetical protein [archaeon]